MPALGLLTAASSVLGGGGGGLGGLMGGGGDGPVTVSPSLTQTVRTGDQAITKGLTSQDLLLIAGIGLVAWFLLS